MTTETKETKVTKLREDRILLLVIGVPILIFLIFLGGPAIFNGLGKFAKVFLPNIGVFFGYIYIGIVGFLAGVKWNRKKK